MDVEHRSHKGLNNRAANFYVPTVKTAANDAGLPITWQPVTLHLDLSALRILSVPPL